VMLRGSHGHDLPAWAVKEQDQDRVQRLLAGRAQRRANWLRVSLAPRLYAKLTQ
jgi:hypothetical protein